MPRFYLNQFARGNPHSNIFVQCAIIDSLASLQRLKMQINKSDRNDAVGIARIMQCGWYKGVPVTETPAPASVARPTVIQNI